MLSQNIKKYRKRKRLSQVDLSEKLGVTPQTISNWEKGIREPSISALLELSRIFDITVDCLLGSDKRNNSIEVVNLVTNLNEDKKEKLLDFLKVIAI